MPQISRGFGIRIYMYFEDHPPPHFHAFVGSHEVVIDIATQQVLRGKAPKTEMRRIKNWAAANQADLLKNWQSAQTGLAIIGMPAIT